MKFNHWRNCGFFAITFLIVGCQSYEPKPLDIGAYRNSLESRLIDIEAVTAFSDRLAKAHSTPLRFDLSDGISPSEGEVIALFYNSELRIARLEAGVALADLETAGLWKDPIFGFDGAEISKIDGLRADFKNGWGVVRASNTTPCLVMRFEANTEEELKEIQDKFTSEILNIDSTLEIPNGKE